MSCRTLIVIIEDDAVLRRGLKLVFDTHGFDVLTFTDFPRGAESFSNKLPDVVLCDYKLPSTNGIEILKAIRKTDKITPFFLMTGYYKDEIADIAKSEGANDVFEKPLDVSALISSCQGAVKEAQNE